MNITQTVELIKGSLSRLLRELEYAEFRLAKQRQYIGKVSLESIDLLNYLIGEYKLTRSSFELLRDDIDKLHQVTAALLQEEQ